MKFVFWLKKESAMKNMTKLILSLFSGASLAVITTSQAAVLFYEPFDAAGGTTLANLGTPLGGSGSWSDNSSGTGSSGSGQAMTVRANGTTGASSGQTWAGIPGTSAFPNTGGFLEGERRNDNSGSISLSSSVVSEFVDGSTIWLSFVAGATLVPGQPDNHHKPNVAIGQGALLDDRAQSAAGQAVGGGVAHNTSGGNPRARWWDGDDFLGNSISRISPQQLFITKIEFGAASETITTAVFDIESFAGLSESDFNNATQSTITTPGNLDNATFDTLSFHGSRSNFDEIRLATTFDAAVGLGAVIPEPSSVFLSLIGLGFVAVRRRR